LGVFLGVVGSELLRALRPELIKKIEDCARSFVDIFVDQKSGPEKGKK